MAGKPMGKAALTATERQRRWWPKKRRQAIFGPNRDPAARRPTPKREDFDFWPTPPEHTLTTAILRGADLRSAQGLTREQLDQTCGENVKLDPPLTIKPCQK